MSVREYVGARYVPLFANPAQWSSNNSYEPLTIVVNEGNSYTSIQYVPKGIDITNESYWALTGNYNAQVEQYRQEVSTFDNRISTLEGSHDTVVVIGDSWSYNASTWLPGGLIGDRLAKNLGAKKAITTAVEGSGFVGNVASSFIVQLNSLQIPEEQIHTLVVIGGINDVGKSGVSSAVNNFISTLNQKYPNTTAYIATVNASKEITMNMVKMENLIARTVAPSRHRHISCSWFMRRNASWNNWFTDNIHLTTAGYEYFTGQLSKVIKTGNASIRYETTFPVGDVGVTMYGELDTQAKQLKLRFNCEKDVVAPAQEFNIGIIDYFMFPYTLNSLTNDLTPYVLPTSSGANGLVRYNNKTGAVYLHLENSASTTITVNYMNSLIVTANLI